MTEHVSENLFFTLLNIIEQDNKYLIATSTKAIVDFNFKLTYRLFSMVKMAKGLEYFIKNFEN